MILRIARLVPVAGHEPAVTDYMRAVLDEAPSIPGLVHGTVARELVDDDRVVVWVTSCWESADALGAYVGASLGELRLSPEIAALVEESSVTHAEVVGTVTGPSIP